MLWPISMPLQIVAGLRKSISKDELLGKQVVVILNLKTAKLAGEMSEGMILAAVQKGEQYNNGELVRPLSPPGYPLLQLGCFPRAFVTLSTAQLKANYLTLF